MSRRGARPAQATRPRRRWHVNFFVGASYNPEDVLPWAGELAFADSLCALVKKPPAVVAGREPAFRSERALSNVHAHRRATRASTACSASGRARSMQCSGQSFTCSCECFFRALQRCEIAQPTFVDGFLPAFGVDAAGPKQMRASVFDTH